MSQSSTMAGPSHLQPPQGPSSLQQPGGPQGATTSTFPAPPDFAMHYTDENIRAGMVLPPPPVPSKFTVFKFDYDLEGVRWNFREFSFYHLRIFSAAPSIARRIEHSAIVLVNRKLESGAEEVESQRGGRLSRPVGDSHSVRDFLKFFLLLGIFLGLFKLKGLSDN